MATDRPESMTLFEALQAKWGPKLSESPEPSLGDCIATPQALREALERAAEQQAWALRHIRADIELLRGLELGDSLLGASALEIDRIRGAICYRAIVAMHGIDSGLQDSGFFTPAETHWLNIPILDLVDRLDAIRMGTSDGGH